MCDEEMTGTGPVYGPSGRARREALLAEARGYRHDAAVEVCARGHEITVTVFKPAVADLRTGIGATVSPERARQLAGDLLAAAGDAERGRA